VGVDRSFASGDAKSKLLIRQTWRTGCGAPKFFEDVHAVLSEMASPP
jgi:hypothetical protein